MNKIKWLIITCLSLTCLWISYHFKTISFKTNYIRGTSVLLDADVIGQMGSWTPEGNLWEGELVDLVFSKLESSLKTKKQVVLLDIGANTGSFVLLPILSKGIKVIAFEPNMTVANVLRRNISINHIQDNVDIYNYGLSDHNGFAELQIPGDGSSGLATFATRPTRFDNETMHRQATQVKKLDDIIEQILPLHATVDFIKIDTEGWEYFVLLGAQKTIHKYKPELLIEFNEHNMQQAGVNPASLTALITKLNYSCTPIGPEDIYCQHA